MAMYPSFGIMSREGDNYCEGSHTDREIEKVVSEYMSLRDFIPCCAIPSVALSDQRPRGKHAGVQASDCQADTSPTCAIRK